MTTLVTQLHNGLREDEIYEMIDGLKQHKWTHSITLGVAGDHITSGDVWTSTRKGLAKLKLLDNDVRYAVWICRNIQVDGSEGRPHAHGVIGTTVELKQIRNCFYSYHSYVCRPIRDEENLERWLKYFLPQVIRTTDITNISNEEYG